jgi:hypothetical protein
MEVQLTSLNFLESDVITDRSIRSKKGMMRLQNRKKKFESKRQLVLKSINRLPQTSIKSSGSEVLLSSVYKEKKKNRTHKNKVRKLQEHLTEYNNSKSVQRKYLQHN